MKLKIDGVGLINVGDDFANLSPDDQNAFVAHVRDQIGKGVKSAIPTPQPAVTQTEKPNEPKLDQYQSAAKLKADRQEKLGLLDAGAGQKLLQGMTFGGSDEALALAETPMAMIENRTFNPVEGYKYSKAFQNERLRRSDENTGLGGDIAELAGGVLSGGALARGGATLVKEGQRLLPRIAAMGTEGAGYGGATGFLTGEDEGRFSGAASGAALGGLLGAGIPAVGRGIGMAASPVVSNVMSAIDPQGAARARVARAVGESGRSVRDLFYDMGNASAAGQGEFALADALGNPGQRLLSTVARAPGEGRTQVVDFLNARQSGQAERVGNIIDEGLGANRTGRQFQAAKTAEARRNAAPLYDLAFEGGSVAPLEHQFQTAFAEAANISSQAEKNLATARQEQLLAKAKLSRAGENVYGVNSGMSADREAAGNVARAEKELADATQNERLIRDRLRQAQQDGTANAPGAVWSPRIQQFLDNPIVKSGLSKGLQIQRLEALARGKRFDPTEFAIVGQDEAGNPVVGKVPNMRLLDAAKRGIDDIIEQYRDKTTGRVHLDEYGGAVEQVRKAYVKLLDDINENYKAARDAYAGPASEREAVNFGRDSAMRGRAADVIDTFNNLKNIQKGAFRVGYADKLNEGIERGAEGVNAARKFTSMKARQELPELSLYQGPMRPGEQSEIFNRLGRENTMFETRRQAIGGSQTAENLADQAENQIDPRVFGLLARGDFIGAGGQFLRGAGNVMGGNTPSVRKELADILLTTGENDGGRGLLRQIARDRFRQSRVQKNNARLLRGLLAAEGEFAGSR